MEHQRFAGLAGHAHHLADQQQVVAHRATVVVGADQGGQRAVDGGHALRRLAHRHVGELVRHRRIGEAPRQCFMSAGQDVDREMRAVAEHRQVGRAVHQAPQHQRRIQRQRGEGIDGQPHVAAVGGARRDDGHAGRIAAQQVAQRPAPGRRCPRRRRRGFMAFPDGQERAHAGFLMHGRSGGARHGLVAEQLAGLGGVAPPGK